MWRAALGTDTADYDGLTVTTTLRPYPAYRPSGIPWLGDVPAHWEVRRLKNHVANVVDLTSETRHDDIYLALEHVESWTGRFAAAGDDVSFDSQVKRFRAGDVLFGKLRPYLAKVTYPNRSGVCVGEFLVLRSSVANLSSRYLEQLLRSKSVIDAIDASTFGAKMPRANWQFIGNMNVPLPPVSEQRAIVRYLDHADQRIRSYVTAKKRLVELLQEERQALINQAVTRGLDPNVPLKPSGVPWLGDVPAHWDLLALKRLGVLKSGVGFPIAQQGQQDQEIPFFKVSDMNLPGNDIFMNTSNNSVSRNTAKTLKATIFPAGTIIFPKVGGAMLTNKRRVLTHPSSIDNNLMGCIVTRGDSDFTLLLLRHIDLAVIAKPGPVPAISEGELGDVRVALPPLSEQAAIVEYVDRATARIDAAAARARRQVELLEEYRTRLIADAVTGKLDVREAGAS